MRTCGSCFRYGENWKDAEAKGIKPVYYSVGEYFQKPRVGIRPHAIGVNCPDDDKIRPNHPACKYHTYRWVRNLQVWWTWHFTKAIKDWYRYKIRVPIGSLRKPMPLKWADRFDGCRDKIIPNGEPQCPWCGEYPYSIEQCLFCGQRFLPEETPDSQKNIFRSMNKALDSVRHAAEECGVGFEQLAEAIRKADAKIKNGNEFFRGRRRSGMISERFMVTGKCVDSGAIFKGHYYEIPAPPTCFEEPGPPKGYIVFEDPHTLADWGMPRQMVKGEVDPATVEPLAVKIKKSHHGYDCPNCGGVVLNFENYKVASKDPRYNYCCNCGQRLEWGEQK